MFLILTRSLWCGKLRKRRNSVIVTEQKLHNVDANLLVCVPGRSCEKWLGRYAEKTPKSNCHVAQFYVEQQLSVSAWRKKAKTSVPGWMGGSKSGSKDLFGCFSSHTLIERGQRDRNSQQGFNWKLLSSSFLSAPILQNAWTHPYLCTFKCWLQCEIKFSACFHVFLN